MGPTAKPAAHKSPLFILVVGTGFLTRVGRHWAALGDTGKLRRETLLSLFSSDREGWVKTETRSVAPRILLGGGLGDWPGFSEYISIAFGSVPVLHSTLLLLVRQRAKDSLPCHSAQLTVLAPHLLVLGHR